MPHRLATPEVICVLATGAGALAEIVGVVRDSDSLQRIGLAVLTLGILPIIVRLVNRTSNTRHFQQLQAEFDAYRKAETEAMMREVEDQRSEIEGAAFALALHLARSGKLTAPTGATITTLHKLRNDTSEHRKKIRA